MITMDITLLIQMVNIFVLMFVLNKVLYKPVRKVLADRAASLQKMRDEIEKTDDNAKRRQRDVDAQMAEASGAAKAALDSARAEAQDAVSEKLASIKAEADEGKNKQLADIKSQVETAKKDLTANLDGFAADMAGKILGRSI